MKRFKTYLPTVAAILVLTGAAAAVAFFYRHYDPAAAGSPAPRCLLRAITGHDCPGCGSQRALHALLNGRVAEAWSYNAFIFFAVPTALFYVVLESPVGRRLPRIRRAATHPLTAALITAAILVWWIFR